MAMLAPPIPPFPDTCRVPSQSGNVHEKFAKVRLEVTKGKDPMLYSDVTSKMDPIWQAYMKAKMDKLKTQEKLKEALAKLQADIHKQRSKVAMEMLKHMQDALK